MDDADFVIEKGGYGYHPGVEADKGGDSTECIDCMVAQATRAGRTLVASVLQANDNEKWSDTATMFEAGFTSVFQPNVRASSDPAGELLDHSLSCLSPGRAASAIVTASQGLDVFLWDVDVAGRSVEAIRSEGVRPPDFDLQMRLDPQLPPPPPDDHETTFKNTSGGIGDPHPAGPTYKDAGGGRGEPGPWDASSDKASNEGDPVFLAVDSAYAGTGNLVVAAELAHGLRLYTFGLPQDGKPFLRDWLPAGDGEDFRVVALTIDLLATAHREPDGTLVLQSWSIDPDSGSLSGPLAIEYGPESADVEIAGRSQPLSAQLVAALRLGNGHLQVRSWSVDLWNGALTLTGTDNGGALDALDITHVRGFGLEGVYAVAARTSGGLKVIAYHVSSDGTLERRGDSTGGGIPMQSSGVVEVANFDQRGVFVAHKLNATSPTTRVTAWSIDEGAVEAQPNLIAEDDRVNGRLLGLCRIPDDEAEGDFLLAEEGLFDEQLRLSAWRSGPR